MEKSKKLETYGGLSEKQNAKVGLDMPKVKGYDFNKASHRKLYVEQHLRMMEREGIKGNMIKYRDPQTKNPKMNRERTSAGVIHLQPIAKGVALGMFDTGEHHTSLGRKYKYEPNITLFKNKKQSSGVLEGRIARALASRRGQSSGKAYWHRGFRTWEKKYLDQGYHPVDARILANADPRNPVHYKTFKRGSKEWLGAFHLLEQNIRAANKKPAKPITQGVGALKKHDENYLKKVLGVK